MPVPAVDTVTDWNLLINAFRDIKVPHILTTQDKDLIIQLDSVIQFHFNFQGDYLSHSVPRS